MPKMMTGRKYQDTLASFYMILISTGCWKRSHRFEHLAPTLVIFLLLLQINVNGRSILLPRGRVLGGTSTVNSMTWARGSKQDYDAMVELGNPGWGWDDWFPYMLKSETIHLSSDSDAKSNLATFDPQNHSTDGPIHLSFVPWLGATHRPFFQSLNSLGVSDNPDSVSDYTVNIASPLTAI